MTSITDKTENTAEGYKREYWLHPIVVWPQGTSPEATLNIANRAGYSKIVVAPLQGWDQDKLKGIPKEKVGAVEDSWHPLTVNNILQPDAWLRIFGRRSEAQAPFPWDNLFWGNSTDVSKRMSAIRTLFPEAIFSGHGPKNDIKWPGTYAWEINPDHGISGDEVFEIKGKFAVDIFHLTRPERNLPHRQIASEADLFDFLEKLVAQRGNDIALIHLHLAATEILPYAAGHIPLRVRQSFQILSRAKNGKIPVAVQCLPPAPLNLFLWTSSFLPRRIRRVTEEIMITGYQHQQLTQSLATI